MTQAITIDLANDQAFPSLRKTGGLKSGGELFGKTRTDATQVPDDADQSFSLEESDEEDMDARDKSPWATSPVGCESSVADAFGDLSLHGDLSGSNTEVQESVLRALVPSVGSELHGLGECKPCAWFWKSQGCQNGRDCLHCHLCPKSELKARKKLKNKVRKEVEATMVNLGPPPGLEPSSFEPRSPVSLAPIIAASLNIIEKSEAPQCNVDQSSTTATTASSIASEDETEGSTADCRLVDISVGPGLHDSGLCKPCSWFWKPEGCHNGRECQHCHLCPKSEVKTRKKLKAKAFKEVRASVVGPNLPLSLEPPASELLTSAWCLPAVAAQVDVLEISQGPSPKVKNESHSASTVTASVVPSEDEGERDVATGPDRLSATSVGSALHLGGRCKPCSWYWKASGCANGEDCLHCHMCPEDEIKRRKKIQKKVTIVSKSDVHTKVLLEDTLLLQLQQQQQLIHQQQQQLSYMQMQLQMQASVAAAATLMAQSSCTLPSETLTLHGMDRGEPGA